MLKLLKIYLNYFFYKMPVPQDEETEEEFVNRQW
jgi:hypothetical protein